MLLLHVGDTSGESMESWDVVVIGSGIAALRSAIVSLTNASVALFSAVSAGLDNIDLSPVFELRPDLCS